MNRAKLLRTLKTFIKTKQQSHFRTTNGFINKLSVDAVIELMNSDSELNMATFKSSFHQVERFISQTAPTRAGSVSRTSSPW